MDGTAGVGDAAAAYRGHRRTFRSVPAHRRAGHYLGLRFSGGIPADLPTRLAAAKVYVSVRGQAMRVTPHVWNTDHDVEKLFAVLKTALS